MRATVECKKGSTVRYEYKDGVVTQSFVVKKPYIESYGYVEDTLQADGDALDCYIIGKGLDVGDSVDVVAVAAIICFDEGQRDDKYICIARGSRVSSWRLKHTIKKLVRAIRKYKKGAVVVGVKNSGSWMHYELTKYRKYKKIFIGG
nr:MAG TPA: Inorganic pyrophosphatase [Caudoviricetes sp.]